MVKYLKALPALLIIVITVPVLMGDDTGKFTLEAEFSPVWQSRNDARIPNDTGTKFSLRDIQGSGPFAGSRVFFAWSFRPKHEIGVLVAPFSATATGELSHPVLFEGESFEAASQVRASYVFNSYRITYRYTFFDGARWTWKIGVTGKIRDAKIALDDRLTSAENTDLGLVPLVHLDARYRFAPRWNLHLNMDGLAAPQGRAFDISLKVNYDLSPQWRVGAGYRMLEGGADVSSVYTFAWLHYATASVAFRF
ncbi:MAG TPA: hypothetical protein VLL97_02935 [Acidobacteriota bacterium]|nr:hypothetical protein [Acidobacteriota bacterium]